MNTLSVFWLFLALGGGLVLIALLVKKARVAVRRSTHPLMQWMYQYGHPITDAVALMCRQPGYNRKPFMTARERDFFCAAQRTLAGSAFIVCPQVRLADVITVAADFRAGSKENNALFRQISQWHADIVVLDTRNFTVACVIEIDDRSHQQRRRQRRDAIFNLAVEQAGITLLRVWGIPDMCRYLQAMVTSVDVELDAVGGERKVLS